MDVRDSNGTALADGDTVHIIKDLKLRGSSTVLKRGTVIRGILPFITADIVRVAILIAFPAIALYLPRLFGF